MNNIRTLTRLSFSIMLLTFASLSMAMAGPGTSKKKSTLSTQIKNLVLYEDATKNMGLNGEVVVFFQLDAEQKIQLKGVFGTNEDLITHIETALEGEEVKAAGYHQDEEYQIKLVFKDLR